MIVAILFIKKAVRGEKANTKLIKILIAIATVILVVFIARVILVTLEKFHI